MLAIISRMPAGCLGLLLILHGRELDHSYAVSSCLSATFVAASAWGSPMVGRLIDRHSQFRVLLPCAAMSCAALVALVLLPSDQLVPMFPLAFLAGLTQPPVTACIRALWARTLPSSVLHRVLAVDASLQELTFAVGPLIFVTVAVHSSAAVGIVMAGVTIGLTTVLYAIRSQARRLSRVTGEAPTVRGAMRSRPLRRLVAAGIVMGVAIGMVEIGIIAFAGDAGTSGWIGVLYGVWGLGNLVGGYVLARRGTGTSPDLAAPLARAIAVFAVSTAMLALAQETWMFAALLFVAGIPAASIFALYYGAVGAVSPAASMTEAFTWGTTGTITGLAAGTILGGALAESYATGLLMLVAAAVLVVSALVARTVVTPISEQREESRT